MKTKMTATLAVAIVAVMVFAAAGATTYSWFSDSEETEITINTGSLDVSTSDFDVKHNGLSLVTDHGSIPGLISVQYDDGRSATTKWWTDSDRLTIAGNPANVNIEILYKVTFSGNIDYKYIIDVVCPEGINATVSVKDEGGNAITYGSWKAPASEPTGPFTMTFDVSISITSIKEDVYGEKLKIVNMITQYQNPIDIWDGSTPTSMPDTLKVDVIDKVISINDAKALAYLSTLNNNWDASAYGSKWKYTIELNTNIDLNGLDWTPINLSNFVAFDGNGHTIYNLNVNGGDNVGLFASITCDDTGVTYVKDLSIVNAVVEGKHDVGALVGNGKQAAVSNVVVDNAVITGTKYVGGIFGWGNGSVNDCVVKNSYISIKNDGEKEAGGLVGYLSNDGNASTVNKVISGNLVENVTVFAPTIASGLVSQPNSSNTGGAIIVIKDNTMIDVVVSTNDASASLYVSNNVGGKTSVVDNSATGCQINHGFFVIEDPTNIIVPKSEGTTDVNEANIAMPDFGKMVTISAQIVADAPADFKVKLNGSETVIGGISVDIKDKDGNSIHDLSANPATVTMKVRGVYTSENLVVYHEDGTIVSGVTFTNDGTYTTITFNADKFSSYYAVESPAFKIGDEYYFNIDDALDAIDKGETLELIRDCTVVAKQSSGYGKAAIVVDGFNVDGNDNTLFVKGSNGTWDCGIAAKGGEISNITLNGSFRGIFMPGATGDVIIDNVVFENVTYTFNSDAGSKNYSVLVKNSVLNGWTSFSDVHKSVTFENCKFGKGNGYAFCRPYQATLFSDCEFADGFKVDAIAAVEFNNCTFGDGFSVIGKGPVTVDGIATAFTIEQLKSAIDGGCTNIAFGQDITGDLIVTQNPSIKITIDGKGKTFAGVITVDGQSGTYTTAGLTVKNVNFKADKISADACIRLGDGTNVTRYTCNVTVENCTFDVPGAVGVKSYTGGDKNLTISGCTATAKAHSLVQAKGIDGILVKNCIVISKNGLNFNNSTNVTVDGCTVDVRGYAVRFGESSGGSGAAEIYSITNCTLKSDYTEGDATIILRGTADNSTLTIVKTTIEGTVKIQNTATNATIYIDGYVVVEDNSELSAAISAGKEKIYLKSGNYSIPDVVAGKTITIAGGKGTVISTGNGNNGYVGLGNANITFEGVTIKGQNSGQYNGFAHAGTMVYKNCTIEGTITVYSNSTFENCVFNLPTGCYVWTAWGPSEVTYSGCTFNTAGKALLVYHEGGVCTVNVNNCTFNATSGDKAGAIVNQNCAAIEIDNSGKGVGTGSSCKFTINTSGNTIDSDFSGEWRIKTYDPAGTVTVNGQAYNSIAIDGKAMNIDGNKNVTVVSS